MAEFVTTDEEVLAAFPDVRLDHDNKDFYRGILERRYLVNRCADCDLWHTPPRSICPHCWSTRVVATEVEGTGTVELVTFLHQGPPAPGVDYTTPYPLVAVALDGVADQRVSGTVVNAESERIEIGLKVRLVWIERDGLPYPAFEPWADR